MPGEFFAPLVVPDHVWQRDTTVQILRERDVAALLRLVQQYTGASQGRLASALDISQGRVNELINKRRTVTALGTFERIAAGFRMPDSARLALGLAPVVANGVPVPNLVEVTAIYSAQANAAEEIRTLAKVAKNIDVLAVRGLGILGLNNSLLRDVLNPDTRLRVLFIDPESEASAQRAEEIGESPESFAAGVNLSIARIKELANPHDHVVELYLYQSTPVWRIIRLDHVLFVSAFTSHHEGHTSPVHKIEPITGGVLHPAFLRTLSETFKTSTRVV